MSAYHDISIPNEATPPGTTILLVDSFHDITKRADLRPDTVVAFEADWSFQRTSHRDEPTWHRITLHTTFGKSYVVDVHPKNDAGEHFANILDDLATLIGGTCPSS